MSDFLIGYPPGQNTLGMSNLGNSSGTSGVVTGPSVELLFAGGNNITLSQSINGASGTISIIGGAGGGGAGTQTLSANGTYVSGTGVSLALAGAGGISAATASAAGDLTVTMSYTATSNFTGLSLSGNTASSTAFSGNSLVFSAQGALSFIGSTNASGGTISMSVPAQTAEPIWLSGSSIAGGGFNGATATASASTLSIIAGSGITISQNSSNAITISGNTTAAQTAQPVWLSGTSIAGGSFSGATATISASTLSLIAGPNITLSQNSSNAITISGANAMGITGGGAGSTSNASGSSTGTIWLQPGANITLSGTANTIVISGGAGGGGGAGTQTLSANGTSVSGTGVSLALVAGNNISLATATAAGDMTVTISNSLASKISLTQNLALQEVGQLTSTSGTLTGPSGYGSSLFLNRIFLPAAMTLTEADLVLGLSFNATSNGAGTLSRSMVLYSFGNSTSLASIMSASSAYTWLTGTVTAAGSTSLSQYQGGWQGTNIIPLTFATSSVSAGEYVVGNLINFAQGSSTWSLTLIGGNAAAYSTQQVASAIGSTTMTAISNLASLAITNVEATATHASSTGSWGGMSGVARTILTASTTATAVSSLSLSTLTLSYLATSTLPAFGYLGTGTAISTAFPAWFSAGIMSTGAVPTSIAITSNAVTFSGSTALIQPWFALVGS